MTDGYNGTLTLDVKNTGSRNGTEVVQVYVRDVADAEGPLKSLRAFQRVEVKAGQTASIRIPLTEKTFELFDPQTNTVHAHPGRYEIFYGSSSRPEDLKRIEVNL
jgi:beta-glucosidase